MHIRVQHLDERAAKLLTLASVEARLACEAPDGASSCRSALHGSRRHRGQGDHEQNELGTDLKGDLWDWAGSLAVAAARLAAAGGAAGHRARRAATVAAAGRTHRTWAEAGPRRARQCAQAQKPVSGQRRG
jgi:hypothetical protein